MYKVVVGALWVDGVKYRRGETLKLSDAQVAEYGVRVEPAPKVKRTRKKAVKDED